ncbi:hypothetical protein C8R34_1487 [Nitrosomonas sp. Nm84]|uniref:hypothetical protein n=1 Tax=Nitrosomonas sp. Nm84 TaxID=200124 RepID=UPI000D76A275|nr:hypothetical protein [Nitrosomonas sp. Nm84]PXW80425.1 hypothetical protein C8R34_1487 [Nitrosomonas sp. Nm84]
MFNKKKSPEGNTLLISVRAGLFILLIANIFIIGSLWFLDKNPSQYYYIVGFFLNTLSAITIATVLAFLLKKDNPLEPFTEHVNENSKCINSMLEELKDINSRNKIFMPNMHNDEFKVFIHEIYLVNKLIEQKDVTRIAPKSYIGNMKTDRTYYDSSYHIFPLTYLSLDGYYQKGAVGGKWFDFEFQYIKDNQSKKDNIKRILIIDDEIQDDLSTKEFIERAIANKCNWRYMNKCNLEEKNLFRNFALFFNTKGQPEVAYFTYFDLDDLKIFTKSSWAAYKTNNCAYKLKLKDDFESLWKKCIEIEKWHSLNNN